VALVHFGSRVASCDECGERACCGVFYTMPRGPQRLICAFCLRTMAHAIDIAAATLRARCAAVAKE